MKYLLTCTTAFLLLLQATPPGLAQSAGSEWETLRQEINELYRAGKYERAIVVTGKALELAEKNVGHNHPDVASGRPSDSPKCTATL